MEQGPDADAPQRGPGAPPEFQRNIRIYRSLVDELNRLIESPDFYHPEDWESRPLPTEAEELIEAGVDQLTDIRRKRLNRILIATALAPHVEVGTPTALQFYYAAWEIPIPAITMTHGQFARLLSQQLTFYFDKFVLSIGLFIAIIVTANMIPETFEPGVLNLLLSKPITRWGLFLAKFFGGCVFIALCAGYLFVGLWLWLGLAMDFWDRAMLFSIPLYILVFAIYFSVSALVGLIWRSAIVSVILTLLFWAFCFALGSVHGFLQNRMENGAYSDVAASRDNVFAVDALQSILRWEEGSEEWVEVLGPDLREEEKMGLSIALYFGPLDGMPRPLGPAIDESNDLITATRFRMNDIQSAGRRPMYASRASTVDFRTAGSFPRDAMRIATVSNGILVATGDGYFHRLDTSPLKQELDQLPEADAKPPESGNQTDRFIALGPDSPVGIRNSDQVAFNFQSREIAVYSRGTLYVFQPEDEGYRRTVQLSLDIDFDRSMSCAMDYQGDRIVLAFGNGLVMTIDRAGMKELNEYWPETRSAVMELCGSPDGRWFALRYRNGQVWILDRQEEQTLRRANIIGQGSVSAISFDAQNRLWVIDRTDRASGYDLASNSVVQRCAPSGTWLEKSYRYFLHPFYRVAPKPGEFYKLVTYLSSASNTRHNKDVDLRRGDEPDDPWSPLWSGLGFMSAMLFIACVIFQYKDF